MIIIRHVVFEISAASCILFLVALFFPGLCFFIYTECFFSPLLFDYVIGAGLLYEYIFFFPIYVILLTALFFSPFFPPLYFFLDFDEKLLSVSANFDLLYLFITITIISSSIKQFY